MNDILVDTNILIKKGYLGVIIKERRGSSDTRFIIKLGYNINQRNTFNENIKYNSD